MSAADNALAYSYTHINTATTTVVRAYPGVLHTVIVNTPVASGTVTIYDNTAASGTIIAVISSATFEGTLTFDVFCTTGITVVTNGTSDITVTVK